MREKTAETGEFVEITRRTKALCDKYGVPVLVNDRVDVALAAGVAGVHIGQDDMDPAAARKLIGEDAVLGLSVSTVAEAEDAVRLPDVVLDYVGVGAVWSTASKDVSKKVMLGPSGAGEILDVIADSGLASVAIGTSPPHSMLIARRHQRPEHAFPFARQCLALEGQLPRRCRPHQRHRLFV